jgi:hypothetical protein
MPDDGVIRVGAPVGHSCDSPRADSLESKVTKLMHRRWTLALTGWIAAAALLAAPAVAQDPATQGQWTAPFAWPHVAIHMAVLPNGKVYTWERGDSLAIPGQGFAPATLWDPAVPAVFTSVPYTSADLFCVGFSLRPDGQLFMTGGHFLDHVGIANTTFFDPATNTYTPGPTMNAGRWYPTNTVLANGDVVIVSGDMNGDETANPLPQVLQANGTLRDLTGALWAAPLYPRMFLAPDGRVFSTAPNVRSRWLKTDGTGVWRNGPFTANNIYRSYGAAVMYAPGKILMVGGGEPPTATAEVIDLNVATPAWRNVAPLQYARRHLNATLLPDGKVLVTGGTSAGGFNKAAGAVFAAELWDPATETWTTLAAAAVPRLYHSTAVLLPDGRVLSAGGGRPRATDSGDIDHLDAEIFSPPYLFKPDGSPADRPSITSWPATVNYNVKFTINVTQRDSIQTVSWIRLSAATHASNMEQRFMTLTFVKNGASKLKITPPKLGKLSPPGYYLLFAVNSSGVPSVGRIIRIQ